MAKPKTKEQFIKEAKVIHGNKYDYESSIYLNARSKINIYCNTHNIFFLQTPGDHLIGKGCKDCANISRREKLAHTKETFISEAQKVHGNKYDYTNSIYINALTKTTIWCNSHKKSFNITPSKHINGQKCRDCSGEDTGRALTKTTGQFIIDAIKIHNNKYDYTNSIYLGANITINIYCNICKTGFNQSPTNHLSGKGCPCLKTKNQTIVYKFLIENNFNFKNEFNIPKLLKIQKRNSKIDFYLQDYNMFIEYDGKQHFELTTFGDTSLEQAKENFQNQLLRDQALVKYCETNNINLLRIDGRKYYGKKLIEYLNTQFLQDIKQFRKKDSHK
jgi:hypothetical protein